jgi:hypothetical protein
MKLTRGRTMAITLTLALILAVVTALVLFAPMSFSATPGDAPARSAAGQAFQPRL